MNVNREPFVSVLMTSYNREKYIAEAIESVLASTYTNFELIIVDDCSKDNTVAIATAYAKKDSRIRLYVNDTNLRQFPNRNKAVGLAKGKYIVTVDSDDTVYKDGIENIVKAMEAFPEAAYGMYYLPEQDIPPFMLDSKTALRRHFFEKPFLTVGPGGCIIKRDFILQLGGYTTKYDAAGDMYFNLLAVSKSPVVLLPFEFFYYRVHGEQELNNPYAYLYNSYRYLNDALHEIDMQLSHAQLRWLHRKNKRRFLSNLFKYFFRTKNIGKTLAAAKTAGYTMADAFSGAFHFYSVGAEKKLAE